MFTAEKDVNKISASIAEFTAILQDDETKVTFILICEKPSFGVYDVKIE